MQPGQREAIILRHFQDFSISDIAASLRVPIGTVKSRLSAARAHLRRRLTFAGVGPEGMVDALVLLGQWRRVAWANRLLDTHTLTGDLHWEKTFALPTDVVVANGTAVDARSANVRRVDRKGADGMGATRNPRTGFRSMTKANRVRLTDTLTRPVPCPSGSWRKVRRRWTAPSPLSQKTKPSIGHAAGCTRDGRSGCVTSPWPVFGRLWPLSPSV